MSSESSSIEQIEVTKEPRDGSDDKTIWRPLTWEDLRKPLVHLETAFFIETKPSDMGAGHLFHYKEWGRRGNRWHCRKCKKANKKLSKMDVIRSAERLSQPDPDTKIVRDFKKANKEMENKNGSI